MSSQVGRKPGSHVWLQFPAVFLRMHVLQAFQEPRRCAEAACTGEVVNKYDHTLGEPGHSLHSSQLLTAFTLIRLIHRLDLFEFVPANAHCRNIPLGKPFKHSKHQMMTPSKHSSEFVDPGDSPIQWWQNLHARDSFAHLECIPPARSLTRITTSADQPRPNDMNDMIWYIYILYILI